MKKSIWTRVILVMTVLMLVLVTACEQPVVDMKPTEPEQKPTPVPGVKLDRTTLMLAAGETAVLKATVEPANAAVQTLTWSAEPAGVVTLTDNKDGSCTVAYAGDGTATVTVKTADGKTAQCRITTAGALTNWEFIQVVELATAKAGSPIGWVKEDLNTVKLTPENLEKIRAVTELNLNSSDTKRQVNDFSGIEWFTGLTHLSCSQNELTALDVSNLTALTELDCSINKLTSLDVSKNTLLTVLKCQSNKLTSLDVSDCPSLTTLDCSDNESLATLNMSGCLSLTTLNCSSNGSLATLNMSGYTALKELDCSWNNLTSLDVSGCTSLTKLECYPMDSLISADVSGCTSLTTLQIRDPLLKTVDVSGCTSLTQLNCSVNSKLTDLNVSDCPSLTTLDCHSCQSMTTLDVSGCPSLTMLNCRYGQLTALDVSGCRSLTTLDCCMNALTTLDVSANRELTDLTCYSNCLKELDIRGNKALQTWTCGRQTVDKTDEKEQELTLILTEEQNRLWETTESTARYNEGVTVIVLGDGGEVISKGVTLNQSELWLTVNETAELIATVNPTMATNKKVRWSVTPADVDVVTLTDKGDGSCTVMLAKEGTATVTVTTEDSGKTAQCEVKFVEVIDNRDFIKAVGTQCDWTVEENGTVKLTPENKNKMSQVGILNINNQGLSDLSDIKYFTNLVSLYCHDNQLTVLDVSENSSLEYLNCAGNQLTELNLGSLNNKLKQLVCHLNRLTTLNVSMHSNLEMLQCGNQTSNGTTPQNLDLWLKSSQKGKLNESLSGPFNENVTIREISG